MSRKLPKRPKRALVVGDVIRLPLLQSDGRKSRPVIIEDIRNNRMTFRPITDFYRDRNLTNSDSTVIKEEVLPIKDWRQAGLEKPSAVAFGVQRSISMFDLPDSVLYYGRFSEADMAKIPTYDDRLKDVLAEMLEKHSHAEIGQVLNPRLSVLKNFYEYLYHMIYIGNIYATGAFSGQELDLKICQALGELAKSMQETCKDITLGDSIENTIKLTTEGMVRDIKSVNGGNDV